MDDLTKLLKKIVSNVTEEEYQNAVNVVWSDNKEKMTNLNTDYAAELLSSIIRSGYVAPHEKLHFLKSIEFADFREFCQQLLTGMKIRALIQENFTVDEAKSIVRTVETNLGCKKTADVS